MFKCAVRNASVEGSRVLALTEMGAQDASLHDVCVTTDMDKEDMRRIASNLYMFWSTP